jgi:hypothetical protein
LEYGIILFGIQGHVHAPVIVGPQGDYSPAPELPGAVRGLEIRRIRAFDKFTAMIAISNFPVTLIFGIFLKGLLKRTFWSL